MELWIRSQSRHNLMKVNDIVAEDNKIAVYKESENSTIVGKYKTKERALEVLDEIQSKLKQQFIVKNDMILSQKDIDKEELRLTWKYDKEFIMQDSGFEILPINNNVVIYEMPKE